MIREMGERNVPWYIDPHFNEIRVPDSIRGVQDALFPDGTGIAERIARVNAAVLIMDMADMSKFREMFDTRSTYCERMSSVKDLYGSMKNTVLDLESKILESRAPGLFAPSGDVRRDGVLKTLEKLSLESYESTIRVGAVLFSYCMQLDRLMGSGTNG